MRKLGVALALALAVAGAAALAYMLSLGAALDRLAVEARASLKEVVGDIDARLEPYRKLPFVLSDSPVLRQALAEPTPQSLRAANLFMERQAAATGAADIYLIDPSGLTIAASNWAAPDTFVGSNYAYRPYFRMAMDGALGRYYALGSKSNARGFYFAHAVGGYGERAGVVVVKVSVDRIETDLGAWKDVLLLSDLDGIVFLSNRRELIFRSIRQISPDGLKRIEKARRYPGVLPEPLPALERKSWMGRDVVDLADPSWEGLGLDFPEAVLETSEALRISMRARVLSDTAPAHAAASEAAMLAGAVTLALGLGVLLVLVHRARLAERLRIKAAANALLEVRVEERTAALTHEVAERRAAEEALRRTQDDLIQASKLSALGQMSAGISHELNQPLAAIRSFADNGRVLLYRGRHEEASENLTQISELTARMARIIRNLRAFARKEGEPATDVALDRVVQDALDLLARRIEDEGVEIEWHPVAVSVRGGAVRLAQVVVNLLTNAMDAMAGQDVKRVIIAIEPDGPRTRLVVRDTGPGLAPGTQGQVFDPFFTTKAVGSGEGLGLGLSISYGIVQSFGGAIRGANHEEGGAVFTVDLPTSDLPTSDLPTSDLSTSVAEAAE